MEKENIKPVPAVSDKDRKLGWEIDFNFLCLVSDRTWDDFYASLETVESVIKVLMELGYVEAETPAVPFRKTIEQLAPWAEGWAKDRGILDHGTPEAQAEKTIEEAKELLEAIREKDPDGIKEELGDNLVTLIIQAKMQDLALSDCLEYSLRKINDRSGRMVNGTFVKETGTE
ncbi:MAG: MazG-like family protein [Desulfobacteraceae bacterium]|nr:MazG-like family protein [Desulfobacteraceae bacterium]